MGRLAPKPGDVCQSCAAHWENQNPPKPRMRLVLIGSTERSKIPVAVCPYCDGERAISLSKTQE